MLTGLTSTLSDFMTRSRDFVLGFQQMGHWQLSLSHTYGYLATDPSAQVIASISSSHSTVLMLVSSREYRGLAAAVAVAGAVVAVVVVAVLACRVLFELAHLLTLQLAQGRLIPGRVALLQALRRPPATRVLVNSLRRTKPVAALAMIFLESIV